MNTRRIRIFLYLIGILISTLLIVRSDDVPSDDVPKTATTEQGIMIATSASVDKNGIPFIIVFLRNDSGSPKEHLSAGKDSGFAVNRVLNGAKKNLRYGDPTAKPWMDDLPQKRIRTYRLFLNPAEAKLLSGQLIVLSTKIYDPATKTFFVIESAPSVVIQ